MKNTIYSSEELAFYWGNDWIGDYPTIEECSKEQQTELQELRQLLTTHTNKVLDSILSELEKYKKIDYPEFHTIKVGSENTTPRMVRHDGYNEALTEVKSIIEKHRE